MKEESLVTTEKEVILPPYIKMYDVPGYDPVTLHSLKRYQKDKLQDEEIRQQIAESPQVLLQKIESALVLEDSQEKNSLITSAIKSPNVEIRRIGAQFLSVLNILISRPLIEACIQDSDSQVQKYAVKNITQIPEGSEERSLLNDSLVKSIKEGFVSPNHKRQTNFISLITKTSSENWPELIRFGMEVLPKNSILECVYLISYIQDINERVFLVRLALNHSNPDVQGAAAFLIDTTSNLEFLKGELVTKIENGLLSDSIETQIISAELIGQISEGDVRLRLIEIGLKNANSKIQKICINTFVSSSHEGFLEKAEEIRKSLLKKVEEGVKSNDLEVQNFSVGIIEAVPESERVRLVEQALRNPNVEIQEKGLGAIFSIRDGQTRVSLMSLALESPHVKIQLLAAESAHGVRGGLDNKKLLEGMIFRNASKLLSQPMEDLQKEAIQMIRYCSEDEIYELLKQSLASSYEEIQKEASSLLYWLSNKDKERELLDIAIKKGIGEDLVSPPLYKNKEITDESFSRKEFIKTGSGTTLIGGKLKDKTIIRHITPDAFLSWQSAYENYELWKANGFDYVPIEPIQSYSLNKEKGEVDVYSTVLDLSLAAWLHKTGIFVEELFAERDRILKVLSSKNIVHGHTHDGNFCLRFFRKDDGKIDFAKVPRLYLIDFDQAKSQLNGANLKQEK